MSNMSSFVQGCPYPVAETMPSTYMAVDVDIRKGWALEGDHLKVTGVQIDYVVSSHPLLISLRPDPSGGW